MPLLNAQAIVKVGGGRGVLVRPAASASSLAGVATGRDGHHKMAAAA
jgi:hypothetical protein